MQKTSIGMKLLKFSMALLLFIVWGTSLSAQVTDTLPQRETRIAPEDWAQMEELEDTIALLAYAVINDSLPEHRFGTCRQLIPTLVKALKHEHSFEYPFASLQSVSILYPPDSTFRIFTWQLYVDVNEYRYFGAIQMNTPELELFPLIDRSFEIEDPEHARLDPEKWYGAVYYNLREVTTSQGKYYLLFGFDGNQLFQKRKLIEVLQFTDGKPVFGAPVFYHPATEKQAAFTKSRVLREYSAEVSTRLNYDELLEIIIFDHLLEANGKYGEGLTYYPDGSYEGYELRDGIWVHIEKVFHQAQDEAPRPSPILDGRTKDLFGREKGR